MNIHYLLLLCKNQKEKRKQASMTRKFHLQNMLFLPMPCDTNFLCSDTEHSRSLHPEMHPAQAMRHHETTDLLVPVHEPKTTTIFRQKRDQDNFASATSKPTVKCETVGQICSSGKQYAPTSHPCSAAHGY
jgi:hypothetical protein